MLKKDQHCKRMLGNQVIILKIANKGKLSFYIQTVSPDNQVVDEGKFLFVEISQLKTKE